MESNLQGFISFIFKLRPQQASLFKVHETPLHFVSPCPLFEVSTGRRKPERIKPCNYAVVDSSFEMYLSISQDKSLAFSHPP